MFMMNLPFGNETNSTDENIQTGKCREQDAHAKRCDTYCTMIQMIIIL